MTFFLKGACQMKLITQHNPVNFPFTSSNFKFIKNQQTSPEIEKVFISIRLLVTHFETHLMKNCSKPFSFTSCFIVAMEVPIEQLLPITCCFVELTPQKITTTLQVQGQPLSSPPYAHKLSLLLCNPRPRVTPAYGTKGKPL